MHGSTLLVEGGLKAEGHHRCSSGRVGGARHVVGRPCLDRAEAMSRGEAHAEEQAGARAEHRSQLSIHSELKVTRALSSGKGGVSPPALCRRGAI